MPILLIEKHKTIIDNIIKKSRHPANALFIKRWDSLRGHCIYMCSMPVFNAIVFTLHAECNLHVFSVVCFFKPSELIENLSSKQREWSWSNLDCVHNPEHLAQEDSHIVFRFLDMLEDSSRIPDFYCRRYRHYGFVFKTFHNFSECIGCNKRIGIKASYKFYICARDSQIKRRMLAAVFFLEEGYLRVLFKRSHCLKGAVRASVINNNDTQPVFRVIKREK